VNAHDETALPRDDSPRPGALHWAVLAALCLLPTFQTVVTVYLEFHSRITYPLLKAAIIAAPLVTFKWAECRAWQKGSVGGRCVPCIRIRRKRR